MIKRWGYGLGFRKRVARLAAIWILLAWQFASAQVADIHKSEPVSGKGPVSASPRKFDVVSIRLSEPGSSFIYGVGRDDYVSKALPLAATILTAYFPQAFHSRDRMVGAPDWVWHTHYDFMGKVAPVDLVEWTEAKEHSNSMVDNPLLEAMLQNALAERCKLVAHRVPGEVQGYALVLDKHGPNWKTLKEAKPDAPAPPMAIPIPGGGKLVPILSATDLAVTYINTSMASFAAQLPGFVGAPVEDRTGLNGKYDFKLRRFDNEPDQASTWDWESLGMKLERIKLPTEVLVIDHIEKPSPN